MARRIASSILVCCVFAALVTPALAGARLQEPRRFDPATDGDLVQLVNPVDGRTWGAWTYRNGSETDIAISSLDTATGRWSEPFLVGRDDRTDQRNPALAIDERGSIYLAFAERETGLVKLSALARGAMDWTPAVPVGSRGKIAQSPSLKMVADRVVLAYVADGTVRIHQFLPAPPVANMTDGPDPYFGDHPPFPTEEDCGSSGQTTLDNPDEAVDIDATGINTGGSNEG